MTYQPLWRRTFKRGTSPSFYKKFPPSLSKGRGLRGIGYLANGGQSLFQVYVSGIERPADYGALNPKRLEHSEVV
jgi:hypothetical protein